MASTPTIASSDGPAAIPFAGFGVPSAPAFPDEAAVEAPAARLLMFGVHERIYACEIGDVREIIPFRRITRLPGAPTFVLGLLNLRGSVVTVLDLGVRLGGDPVDRAAGSIVLVESGTRLVGLAVSELRDVQPIGEAVMQDALRGADGGIVRGIVHLLADAAPAADADPADGTATSVRDDRGAVVVLLDVRSIIEHALL